MNAFLEEAAALSEQIVRDRRTLHEHPEIGFDLPRTSAYVKHRLAQMDIEAKDCGGPVEAAVVDKFERAGFGRMERSTGVVATIGHGQPCIMLRADMDALPITEVADVPYRSTVPGAMHACGHDAHTAMLLGAAQILKNHEKDLRGTVKLMFQTGEETGYGSRLMIERGLLENPRPDAAFAMHVMPDWELGEVSYAHGSISSSMDTWIIRIQGRGGHSSNPQQTIDPNMIATQLYTQLNLMMTREASPSAMVTFTIGAIQGGTATNIIPNTAVLQGNMRTLSKTDRDHLVKRVPEMIEHIVAAWGGTCEVDVFDTPTTYNDETLLKEVVPIVGCVVGQGRVRCGSPLNNSEDFSHVSAEIPSVFMLMGAGGKGWAPVHNPGMVLDEDALALGAAMHAAVAVNWLEGRCAEDMASFDAGDGAELDSLVA